MKRVTLERAVVVLVIAYGAYLVGGIWQARTAPPQPVPGEPGVEQVPRFWDFHACYYNGRAYRAGTVPYFRTLRWDNPQAGLPVFTFLYHPLLLWFFAALSRVEYRSAYALFLLASVAALAGTVLLWRRVFLGGVSAALLALVCLLGFNSALYIGLEAGNIATFDVALLWLAFYFYLRDRPLPFVCLVVAVSLGKVFPAAFLGLSFFVEGRRKRRYLLWSLVVLALVHGGTWLAAPSLLADYARQKVDVLLHPLEKAGGIMPSTMHMLKSLFFTPAARGALDFGEALVLLLCAYLGLSAVVIAATVRAFRRLRLAGEARRGAAVMLAVFVYALVVPHFKDYSYALLIPPACVVISRQRLLRAGHLLALAVTVPYLWTKLPGLRQAAALLVPYGLVFVTYGLWALYLASGRAVVVERKPGG